MLGALRAGAAKLSCILLQERDGEPVGVADPRGFSCAYLYLRVAVGVAQR